jgi:vitamin B12 transporter
MTIAYQKALRSTTATLAFSLLANLIPAAAQAEEAASTLDDMIVTASRIPTPLAKVGSSVTVITEQDIENRQNVLVSDLLREVPSLAVNRTSTVGSTTQVRIRGAEGNHTLVLIDGVRMNNPAQEREFYFSNLLSDDVGHIEILRGAQSTLYGSEAIGGVISITSRQAAAPLELRALAEGGSFNTARGNLSLLGKQDKIDYALSASGYRTDGVPGADARDGNTKRDGFRNGTFGARLGVELAPDAKIRANLRYTDSRNQYDPLLPPDYILRSADGVEYDKSLQASLGLDVGLLDNRFINKLSASYSNNKSHNFEEGLLAYQSVSDQYRGDYQGIFEVAKGQTITAGTDVEKQRLTSTYFNRTDSTNYGVFGLYQADLTEALTVTAGLRHDHYNSFGNTTTYRFTAAYLLPDGATKLRATYGTGYQAPTLTELYSFFGNPNLKAEKSKSFDAGIDTSFLGGRLKTEATFFYNKTRDLITYAYDAGTDTFAPFNVNRARAYGVELAVQATPLKNLDLGATYTFTHSKDLDSGTELLRRPRHMASANVHYQFCEKFSGNFTAIYNGRMLDIGGVTLGGYMVANLGAAYKISPALELTARVENLFDARYQEVAGFGVPGAAGYVGIRAKY